MGSIIIVCLIVGCMLTVGTTAIILTVRHRRMNKPKPIDPKEQVRQIEQEQRAEWDREFRRLNRMHRNE